MSETSKKIAHMPDGLLAELIAGSLEGEAHRARRRKADRTVRVDPKVALTVARLLRRVR